MPCSVHIWTSTQIDSLEFRIAVVRCVVITPSARVVETAVTVFLIRKLALQIGVELQRTGIFFTG